MPDPILENKAIATTGASAAPPIGRASIADRIGETVPTPVMRSPVAEALMASVDATRARLARENAEPADEA